jgi:DNA-binding CsgD family transcriptional regulator/cell division protein FtsB
MIKTNNKKLKSALFLISLLIIISLVSLTFIFRQNKQLTLRRKQLSENNDQLTQLNARLNILNAALLDTNHKREGLAKLYIDLCAKYIDRLNKYKNLVRRKIKAHQVNELLSNISSSRLSEEDAATFITRFDKAFLDLYPTFIEEFNNLLEVPQTGKTKHPHAMTPEQRIYALIRLGVKESSEIASLLFYSPQTIYNYRSAVKAKAKNKNTFEDDVINLCTVIK